MGKHNFIRFLWERFLVFYLFAVGFGVLTCIWMVLLILTDPPEAQRWSAGIIVIAIVAGLATATHPSRW